MRTKRRMMNRILQGPDQGNEYFTDERCYILELSNSAADDALSIARARVEPGVRTALHRLNGTVERYVIIEGEGAVEVGGDAPQRVVAGSVLRTPEEAISCSSRSARRDFSKKTTKIWRLRTR
jgi:mannose-6-phosphate isomerase-like protein (cupin superfamily)